MDEKKKTHRLTKQEYIDYLTMLQGEDFATKNADVPTVQLREQEQPCKKKRKK